MKGEGGSSLSLPICCSSEGWPVGGGEIDRTLRYCALFCHAPPQQVGKDEGCWMAKMAGHWGVAVWRRLMPTEVCATIYMQMKPKDPSVPLDMIRQNS